MHERLAALRSLSHLAALFETLGFEPDPAPSGTGPAPVARQNGFRIIGALAPDAPARATALARELARTLGIGLVAVLNPGCELALAAPRTGLPGVTRVLRVPLPTPPTPTLDLLCRLAPHPDENGLVLALRIDGILASEVAGERFFTALRQLHVRMAATLTRGTVGERHLLALLPLTRVLFLYFVQAKGWLDGQPDYLRCLLDHTLSKRRRFHRDALDPLCFGTLNRPATDRKTGVALFGRIPYLNGGLFEPHPVERRLGPARFDNALWRDAFDGVFERFRFCVRESHEVDAIAPDMLGRVFERVMASGHRRETGTFYTPEPLVRQLVAETFTVSLTRAGGLDPEVAAGLLRGRPPPRTIHAAARRAVNALAVLDPAAGSGAFLLGALDALTAMHGALRQTPVPRSRLRRHILRHQLFGVDLNPVAVRLAELRLWLAVITDDPATVDGPIEPLPNLNGVVRQGDTLMESGGLGTWSATLPVPAASVSSSLTTAVRHARHRLFDARGAERRVALQALQRIETKMVLDLLEHTASHLTARIAELRDLRTTPDLFGQPQGWTTDQRRAYRTHLAHRRTVRRLVRRVQDGHLPFFSFAVHTPDVIARGGFPVVLGNPPWVRAERLPAGLRAALRDRFDWWTASGEGSGYAHLPDLAVAFLERALALTRPGGTLGFLLPAKVTTAGYGKAMREALARNHTLELVARVADRPETRFGATAYPLALIATRTPPTPRHRLRIGLGGAPVLRQKRLGSERWALVPEATARALDRFARSGRSLRELAPPSVGLKTGANRIFVGTELRRTRRSVTLSVGGEELDVPLRYVRDVLRGQDVTPFGMEQRRVMLWTLHRDRPRTHLPSTLVRYFTRHRRALERRADYRPDRDQPWTVFRIRAALASHRVVWPDIARRPRAVVPEPGPHSPVPLNSCYVAPTPDRNTALLIAAVLNTTWAAAFTQARADEANAGYRRMNAAVIGALPIPGPSPATDRVITLSRHAHHEASCPTTLDEAVADALELPASTRRNLQSLAHDHR